MTKNYIIQLADYNIWANNIVCTWLEQINDAQWTQEVTSSFNSLQQTVLHVISAERGWLDRFEKNPNIVFLQPVYKGTKEEHVTLWKKTSERLKVFINDFDENNLQTNLDFKRFNGEAFSMPYYQLFAHVINHATYHRGQIVTMLRQTGFTGTSSTDLSSFFQQIKN
jgi:uncharacterized damage-inducible protein DinB